MPVVTFLIPFTGGFLFFYVYSKIYDRLPKLKIKSLQLFPSIKIMISGKIFHLHHWLGFSILLVISIFVEGGLLGYLVTKGILTGGAIQGLFTPKSFKIIYDSTD